MFNTKRIKALEEKLQKSITLFNDSIFNALERITKIERKEIPNIITCSTCKCLIRKEDAIRGQSEVRPKRTVNEKLGDCLIGKIFEVEQEETIFTPYYCHNKDCKPKK